MKRWVCCGLAAVVVALGLGVSDASAVVVRYRGFVGVRAWPAPRVAYWGPRVVVAPPVYVAPPSAVYYYW